MSKIWLNNNWYIPVDDQGFIVGPCYEGMLGCVVALRSLEEDGAQLALKIPRLTADTLEENYYIDALLADEAKVTFTIGSKKDLDVSAGILTANTITKHDLKGTRVLDKVQDPLAKQQDGAILLFKFSKGERPRVSAVKLSAAGIENVFPEGSKDDIERAFGHLMSDANGGIEELKRNTKRGDLNFHEPFVVSCISQGSTGVQGCLLKASLDGVVKGNSWFGGVSSIILPWAMGTLQKQVNYGLAEISKSALLDWKLKEVLELGNNIYSGLKVLHDDDKIHCDVRPANIMVRGNAANPKNYLVGDYGSFTGEIQYLATRDPAEVGSTRVGQSLSAHRDTPFYAPERRAAEESEIATHAIVYCDDPMEGYLVRLTSAEEQFDNEEFHEQVRQVFTGSDADSAPRGKLRLREGDRLHLREYVFQVQEVGEIGDDIVVKCLPRVGTVVHGSLTVYTVPQLADRLILSLSKSSIHRKWGQETDVFGAGSVLLYVAFYIGSHRLLSQLRREMQSDPGVERMREIEKKVDLWEKNYESLFRRLHAVISDPAYHGSFWAEISEFVDTFRTAVEKGSVNVASVTVSPEKGTLYENAKAVAFNLTQSAPYFEAVLHFCEMNFAKSIEFVHFVMSALHREEESVFDDGVYVGLFCRHSDPKGTGCGNALSYIDSFLKRLGSDQAYEEFVLQSGGINAGRV